METYLILGCCMVLLILLILLLGKQHSFQKKAQELLTQKDRIRKELIGELYSESDHLRDEMQKNFRQLYDSLVNTFSNMTRNYSDYVEMLLNQSREHDAQNDKRYGNLEKALIQQLSQMNDSLSDLKKTMFQQLGEMRVTVDEKLTEKLDKRLNDSFAQVSERLEMVYRSLGEMHSLAGGVDDLKHLLGNVKTRGIWGEIQLGNLLSETMTESQYSTNVEIIPGSGERVEFAVCLPGRRREEEAVYLPIDSKFPLEQYAKVSHAAQNADADGLVEAQKSLMNAVKTEAKRIGKYISPPHSTDFAIMFLPIESLYAEVMCHTEAVEAIRREQRILIAGPSTLQALLSSLQMGFQTLAIEKRSAEVWKLLGAVKADFRNYALLLQKTQEKLQQASNSVDTAFRKTQSIEKRLRNVEDSTETGVLLKDGYDDTGRMEEE